MKDAFKSPKTAARWILDRITIDETPTLMLVAKALGDEYDPTAEPMFTGTAVMRTTFPKIADEPAVFEFTREKIYSPHDGMLLLAAYRVRGKRKVRFGLLLTGSEGEYHRGTYTDAEGRVLTDCDDFRIVGTVVGITLANGDIATRNTGLRFNAETGEVDMSRKAAAEVKAA